MGNKLVIVQFADTLNKHFLSVAEGINTKKTTIMTLLWTWTTLRLFIICYDLL